MFGWPDSRLLRWALVAAALLAAAFVANWALNAGDRVTLVTCRAQYERASTAADTQAVDLWRPFLGRKDAIAGLSCGLLRAQGKI